MHMDAEVLNKIPANQIQQYIERIIHQDQVGCIPAPQGWIDIHRSFTCLVRFIPRHLTVFGAVINRIDSLTSLSAASSLLYRNTTDFCTMILYSAILLNSCISSSNSSVESFGFSIYSIISSTNSESMTSSFLIWVPFISFYCLTAEPGTSSTMLNNSGESGHPYS